MLFAGFRPGVGEAHLHKWLVGCSGYLFDSEKLRCGVAIVPDGGYIDAVTVKKRAFFKCACGPRAPKAMPAAPWLTPNPLAMLVKAISDLTAEFDRLADPHSPDHWYPTCVPTACETENRSVNCIPDGAGAVIDFRFPSPHTPQSLRGMVEGIVGPEVTVETIASCLPTVLAPDELYLHIAASVTGKTIRRVRASGGSDAIFISRHGIPVVLSNPLVGNLHREDEWIDVASMETYYRICEQYIMAKLGPRPSQE